MKFSEINASQIYLTFQVVKIFFPRSGEVVHKIAKETKTHVKCYFQLLMLNISSMKELLRETSEIQ